MIQYKQFTKRGEILLMKRKGDAVSPKEKKFLTKEVLGSRSGAGSKTILYNFKNKLFKVAVIVLAVICMAACAVACDVEEEKTSGKEQVEVQVEDVASVSEIYSLLGNSFVLSENVVGAVKAYYGENNVLSIMSENSDGSGNVVALLGGDGLKIAETKIALTAQDFDAKKYKKDTFTVEDKVITYYENSIKKTADLSDKFSYTDSQGDLYIVDVNKAKEKISLSVANASEQELNLKSEATQSELGVFDLLLGNVIEEDKTVFCPTVNSVVYDTVNDVTKVLISYAVSGYTTESCEITLQGDLTENDTLDKEKAQEQFNEESAVFSVSAKDYSKYRDYNVLLSAEQEKGHNVSRIEKVKTLNFENWNEVFEIKEVQDKIIEILQDTLLTDARIKNMFGNDMTKDNLQSGQIEIFKWAFDVEGDQINGVQILGVRKGMFGDDNKVRLIGATFTFSEPINISQMQAKSNGEIDENVVQFEKEEISYFADLTIFFESGLNAEYDRGGKSHEPQMSLTAEHEEIFDLVMPLAVEQGLIGEGDYNFVMLLPGGDIENGKNILTVAVKFISTKKYEYTHISFRIVNEDNDNDVVTIINKAKESGNYRCEIIEQYNFIEVSDEDIVISLSSDATQTYTVKANANEDLQ